MNDFLDAYGLYLLSGVPAADNRASWRPDLVAPSYPLWRLPKGHLFQVKNMDALVEKVTRKIAEVVHPDKIILFGSHAKGATTEESDIDLVVIYSGPKSTRQVRREINRLFVPRDSAMDVIVMRPEEMERYKRVANTLAREVMETGIVTYG